MAIESLLTINSKVLEVEKSYITPLLKFNENTFSTIYCFLSRVTSWGDNKTPTQDQKTLKEIRKNMFFVKKITLNNISPVIQRIDWIQNTIYDYYTDTANLFELDSDGKLIKHFYIKNRYDQVFKCLFNNNDSVSVNEPFFEPGNYSKNNIFNGVDDGYKWKYIYTIDIGSKNKFMDRNWMPIFDTLETQNSYIHDYGYGAIETINVLNSGHGYKQTLTSSVDVIVTGDGTECTARALIAGGKIVDVIVTNPGKNYTYATANVVISGTDASGAGAILQSPVSPIGGHSSYPIAELGCHNIMYVCEFNRSENNKLPTDITFYQAGLINNPVSISSSLNLLEGESYSLSTDIIVPQIGGNYISGEIVYQGDSIDNPTSSATVLSYDTNFSLLKLINIKGELTINSQLKGNTSGVSKEILSLTNPSFNSFSGYISYIENFDGIQRTAESNEQIKIILGY